MPVPGAEQFFLFASQAALSLLFCLVPAACRGRLVANPLSDGAHRGWPGLAGPSAAGGGGGCLGRWDFGGLLLASIRAAGYRPGLRGRLGATNSAAAGRQPA